MNIEQLFLLIKNFVRTDFGIALLITVSWKILLLAIGYFIDASSNGASGILSHTMHWDAGWYTLIINDHYKNIPVSAVFYPLFPLLVGALHFVSFGFIDVPLSGQIINTVAVWFALTALLKIGKELLGTTNQYWLIALFLTAPAAFFLHTFYSEAVFVALAFWAYVFALKRNWLAVGILLAILTASRLPAILIVGLCGLEYLRSYNWDIKKSLNKKMLYFLLSPLGFIAYGLYLHFIQNNAFEMFSAYRLDNDWTYQIFNPNIVETIARGGYQIIRAIAGARPFDNDLIIGNLFPFVSLIVLALASLYLIFKAKGKYLPIGIVGLLSIIMFTLNNNLVSVHRYVLPCLAIYIALFLIAKGRFKKPLLTSFCLVGITGQFYLYWLFVNTVFAG